MPEGIRDTSAQDVRIEKAPHRWRWLRWALPLAVLATLATLFASTLSTWLDAEASVSADRVRIAVVNRGDLIRDLNVQGRVVAAVSPTLYSPATGTATLSVLPGDAVETIVGFSTDPLFGPVVDGMSVAGNEVDLQAMFIKEVPALFAQPGRIFMIQVFQFSHIKAVGSSKPVLPVV